MGPARNPADSGALGEQLRKSFFKTKFRAQEKLRECGQSLLQFLGLLGADRQVTQLASGAWFLAIEVQVSVRDFENIRTLRSFAD